ncbi:NAD-dependent epimerase/dehydratase family protein, partial [Prochlorococcus sp. AH-716-I17]|nr:NAD-dependent epimerase/dehydratase family protein [Prochlorococcus sp. AH-716-I17]
MKRNKRPILITGAAGFIGAALALELLKRGEKVVGIDNLNDYYDISLKLSRINRIEDVNTIGSWKFIKASIDNSQDLANIFEKENPRIVVHLAAQAGVRYSLSHPDKYVASNLVGFANILDQCKKIDLEHFVFASSSSVYGGNQRVPYSEKDSVNHPISFYAATKRSNELMAHSYSHLFNIPTTGLRFFTVYGPWGRPDMAPMIFAKSILKNKSIDVFNNGEMFRDFTYIDDVVEATIKCCYKP